jgi:hypothetical protein
MAEIINLRRARKDKQRRDKASEADDNRRRFGRTRAEKAADEAAAARSRRTLDGKRLDKDGETQR